MVFEGLWSPQTHPKDFPTQAMWLTHFSDIIGATHPTNFSFWGEGKIATDGFRYLYTNTLHQITFTLDSEQFFIDKFYHCLIRVTDCVIRTVIS